MNKTISFLNDEIFMLEKTQAKVPDMFFLQRHVIPTPGLPGFFAFIVSLQADVLCIISDDYSG